MNDHFHHKLNELRHITSLKQTLVLLHGKDHQRFQGWVCPLCQICRWQLALGASGAPTHCSLRNRVRGLPLLIPSPLHLHQSCTLRRAIKHAYQQQHMPAPSILHYRILRLVQPIFRRPVPLTIGDMLMTVRQAVRLFDFKRLFRAVNKVSATMHSAFLTPSLRLLKHGRKVGTARRRPCFAINSSLNASTGAGRVLAGFSWSPVSGTSLQDRLSTLGALSARQIIILSPGTSNLSFHIHHIRYHLRLQRRTLLSYSSILSCAW